jgi:hypothetical protein
MWKHLFCSRYGIFPSCLLPLFRSNRSDGALKLSSGYAKRFFECRIGPEVVLAERRFPALANGQCTLFMRRYR